MQNKFFREKFKFNDLWVLQNKKQSLCPMTKGYVFSRYSTLVYFLYFFLIFSIAVELEPPLQE